MPLRRFQLPLHQRGRTEGLGGHRRVDYHRIIEHCEQICKVISTAFECSLTVLFRKCAPAPAAMPSLATSNPRSFVRSSERSCSSRYSCCRRNRVSPVRHAYTLRDHEGSRNIISTVARSHSCMLRTAVTTYAIKGRGIGSNASKSRSARGLFDAFLQNART